MKRLLLYFSLFTFHFSFSQTDTTFDNHVFNPKRFKVLANSITITGIVEQLVPAPDGDVHIVIKLDSGQGNRINENNIAIWNGCLVAEVICEHEPTDKSGVGYICKGYQNKIEVPKIGEHISVTGKFVTDMGKGPFGPYGWNEIHPVTKIEKLK
jgi:hypothetical protein